MKEQRNETNAVETITISRAEYDAQKAQIAELKGQNEWLMEQLRLLKKKQFGASSEQTRAILKINNNQRKKTNRHNHRRRPGQGAKRIAAFNAS